MIADHEARCRPSGRCDAKDRCARYLAPIPQRYAKVIDGSVNQYRLWMFVACVDFLEPNRKAAAPAPERRVHPPIGADQ